MKSSEAQNNGYMSPLQHRINKHQSILRNYTNQFENTIEPLLQFALILCSNNNHNAAEEILLNIIESELCQEYKKISSIWIIRSEIAEELGQLQKAVKLFQEAAANKAQPFEDIMNAFKSFRQRHNKTENNIRNMGTPNYNPKPMPNPRNKRQKCNKNLIITVTKPNQKLSKPFMPSPISSLPISPISKKVACTPLTDAFENFMFKSDKRCNQRQKKFEFRSRQSKKQIRISMSPTPGFINNNNNISDMSLSTSFNGPPITPNPNIISMDNTMDNSMNISGLSDISDITNTNDLLLLSPDNKYKNKPELPSKFKTPGIISSDLTKKPQRFSPRISTLQAKPAKRYKPNNYNNYNNKENNTDVSQITNRFDSIDIENDNQINKPLTLENLYKSQENNNGSLVRLEVIPLSPSKSKKYGSNKILSPVRRSKRIQNQNGINNNCKQNYKKLLTQSNYYYAPNPMLNTNKK